MVEDSAEQINETSDNSMIHIFRRIAELSNYEEEKIVEIEAEIYEILKNNAENTDALIALMTTQIMLGQRHKAKALAYKVWELGGEFSQTVELTFVNNLIDIGLIEMASVLLKPRFENLTENIDTFYVVFLKFAIETGNHYLLEKTANQTPDLEEKELIQDFIDVYATLNYLEHFKAIQRIILDYIKENLCGYEFIFSNDAGYSELEITLYTDLLEGERIKAYRELDTKIDFYCLTNKVSRLDNINILIEDIARKV